MITLTMAAALGASILSTAFISGIFGMAGGMILMGILLAMMPVAAAMVLHGVTQMASNGWRAWLWRSEIVWTAVAWYAAGSVIAALAFFAVQFAPSKPVTLIALGLLSFAGLLMPDRLAPSILRRGDAVACGTLCTSLQFVAGVSGPIFVGFFLGGNLGRREIVATKSVCQLFGHGMKLAYFTVLVDQAAAIDPLVAALAIAASMLGTTLARPVLEMLTDTQYRVWATRIITAIACYYLGYGSYLLVLPLMA